LYRRREFPQLLGRVGDERRDLAVLLRVREGGQNGDLRDVAQADDGVSDLPPFSTILHATGEARSVPRRRPSRAASRSGGFMKTFRRRIRFFASALVLTAAVIAGAASSLLGSCGPFADFTDAGFCPFVLEIFTLGITTGTSATTYDPTSPASRLQMAAFLSRTVDRVLQRGGRRASLNQFSSPQNVAALGVTTVGASPRLLRFDGADLWVANFGSGTVSRVRASDAKILETWTGAPSAIGVLIAMGRVLVTGFTSPGTPREPLPDRSERAGRSRHHRVFEPGQRLDRDRL
jgi:hypothetical protein